MKTNDETIIIGGGLAGLACATRLSQSGGRGFLLLEATDRVGGRVRTDHLDGFTLDHGLQALLTAYPTCRELLDYDALRLRRFEPGALIRRSGRFRVLGDPWRNPSQALASAMNPVGSVGDKLRVAQLRRRSREGSLEDLYRRPQTTTAERLQAEGFSTQMIDQFWRPFLGGVFLDESLRAPSRMLEFVIRMFASGDVAVPADGMAAIPRQLADRLPQGSLRFRATVRQVQLDRHSESNRVQVGLASGEWLAADRLVIATESDAAARLLGDRELATPWSGTTTVYYAADDRPDRRGMMMLRGDESGVIQSAVVLSNIAPEYAPRGKSLISVTVDAEAHDPETGNGERLDRRIREQLRCWFGPAVDNWRRLRMFRVPYGLPQVELDPVLRPVEVTRLHEETVAAGSLFICGDHRETASIHGALHSGLRAAETILNSA